MTELFHDEGFLSMIYTICGWLVAYIVIKVITLYVGLGRNLLSQGCRRISRLRRAVNELSDACSSQKADAKPARLVLKLRDVVQKEKVIRKILDVYLFDDRSDNDAATARKLLSGVPARCREAVAIITEGGKEQVPDVFRQIDEDMKRAEELLKASMAQAVKKDLMELK